MEKYLNTKSAENPATSGNENHENRESSNIIEVESTLENIGESIAVITVDGVDSGSGPTNRNGV